MSRLILLVVLLCGLASSAWAAPASDTPPSGAPAAHKAVVTNPDWLRRPSGDDVANDYPKAAARRGLGGRATITCHVLATGDLSHCFVRSEEPEGAGFGAAALKMSRLFKMRPKAIDGRPVEGGTVTIPIRFTIDNSAGQASWPAMPEWAPWALLAAVSVVVLIGMALNDALASAAGIRTLPVWKTYGAGLGFMFRSLAAYPAPIALTAAAGALDGWYGLTDPLRSNSPMSLLMNFLGLFVAAAGYRYAFRPLRPNDRAFRLGPLGLQLGQTEARTLMANLGYGLFVLAPLVVIALVGIGVAAVLPKLTASGPTGQALAGGTIAALALILMLLFLLRTWLVIPHIVFRKALELNAPWKATRGAVFSTLALMVLWLLTFTALAMAAYIAIDQMDRWIENSERWAMAAAEGLVGALATPLFVGLQTSAYKRLMDLKPAAAGAARPSIVE